MTTKTQAPETPQFEHDCTKDVFLGRAQIAGRDYDLYYADHGGDPDTLIARFSSTPQDNVCGIVFARNGTNLALVEAMVRAEARGIKLKSKVGLTKAELQRHLEQTEFELFLTKQKLAYFPTPDTNPASEELFKFLPGWRERHNLGEEEELFLLASMLAGRLGVHKSMVPIRKWAMTEDELAEAEECWPTPAPKEPRDETQPLAFQQSDADWLLKNTELAVILLERHIAKKQKEKT